jgi:nitroimidazol reductase NimA-like FMN-containing flavoprotein (pyridoxamine 5'-phosphate oxidase superfamily)
MNLPEHWQRRPAMRRKDREITDIEEKLGIVGRCKVCRLAMIDGLPPYRPISEQPAYGAYPVNLADIEPYLVPLNFGFEYKEGILVLYFHCAAEGRKLDILRNNGDRPVCFGMDGAHRLIENPQGCGYSFGYESVIGKGTVEFVEGREEKVYGLELLLRHQSGQDRDFTLDPAAVDQTIVFRLSSKDWSAKKH